MKSMLRLALVYAVASSVAAHLLGLAILAKHPEWAHKALALAWPAQGVSTHAAVEARDIDTLPPWRPLPGADMAAGEIRVSGRPVKDLVKAVARLHDGDVLSLGPGVYTRGLRVTANNVTIEGRGHVVFKGASLGGKATFVLRGNNARLRNIECYGVKVPDRNGACVRLAGRGLTLDHVYFHDSEQGLLAGKRPGTVTVNDSRFERLGKAGRAHGIYVNGGELIIRDSLFVNALDEGHEIKSRARRTVIERTVVASLGGNDSRLIDIADGGELVVRKSVLEQGPASMNSDLIGYGLEGMRHPVTRIELSDNIIVVDGQRRARILHSRDGAPEPEARGNVIVGRDAGVLPGMNVVLRDRAEAGLPPYPRLPPLPSG